ncbi:MAG: hypothetical protein LBE10_09875 [Treponema sp.]|jgi:hypothetical protein|nr:hypothetical protein [Treponema sp.]
MQEVYNFLKNVRSIIYPQLKAINQYPDTIKLADAGAFPPMAGTGLSASIPQLYLR